MAPIAEAIFLHSLSMWKCHVRFSSTYIPSDFTEETCSIGTLSMESSRVSDRVSTGFEWLFRENLDRRYVPDLYAALCATEREEDRWGEVTRSLPWNILYQRRKKGGQIINNKTAQVSSKPSEFWFGCVEVKGVNEEMQPMDEKHFFLKMVFNGHSYSGLMAWTLQVTPAIHEQFLYDKYIWSCIWHSKYLSALQILMRQ